MIQQIIRHRLTILAILLFVVCLSPLSVAAQTSYVAAVGDASKDAACETVQALHSDTSCGDASESGENLNNLIEVALEFISIAAGVIAVIMIIVAGLKYVTASGDPTNINSAKNTLIYAIVGLVIVALAQFIVRFVLSGAT